MSAACIVVAQAVTCAAAASSYYSGQGNRVGFSIIFAPCDYCGTHPLRGEEEGRCRSCGAPLKPFNDDPKPTT